MSEHDPYTPDRHDVGNVYVDYYMRNSSALHSEAEAEFDRFIEAVKRDAAREALDGLAEQEVEHALSYSARDDHDRYRQCEHAWQAVNDYRHTRYPEETP